MRIAVVTDAWTPQINGVVRTLTTTVEKLRERGIEVLTITPDLFRTLPCPTYPEIRLALGAKRRVSQMLSDFQPASVHIATEGPLGWAARGWCIANGHPFNTSLHTRFPDYVAARTGLPAEWFWRLLRRFHAPAEHILVATPRLAAEIAGRGLPQTHIWSRGVDLAQFSPDTAPAPAMAGLPRPIQLCVGRVAVEKNIEAFLSADTPGSKVVVGDGPALAELRARFPNGYFLGALHGTELAAAYAAADVFVFPSLTDTFGLVLIEALATGTPVAAFPVHGPLDVIGANGTGVVRGWTHKVGALSEDLAVAIPAALAARREDCAAYARHFSWDASTDQFLASIIPPPFAAAA